jgi:hypothetical protein
MRIGYTMMCEQAGPRQLVRDVVRAEEAGFDFADVALVQIGGDQQDAFLDWAPKELLPALQEL